MNEEEAKKIIDNMSEQELNNFIFFALQEVEKENQKLKTELKKKDKMIDEMAVKLKQLREASLDDCFILRSYRDIDDCLRTTCEECIKEYFENKVKESK